MGIEETTIGYTEKLLQDAADRRRDWQAEVPTSPEVKEYWESKTGQPYGEPERTPDLLYSLGFDADELLVTYAALRTYLRALVSQENEDFEQIQRITKLLIALRPRAVKASKALSLKAVGMQER
jgi:hypothetical protein